MRKKRRHRPEALQYDGAMVRLDSVTKSYGRGTAAVTALDDVSITIPAGTFTAVMGPSGSGKSTFLHCAAGLDRPTNGRVSLGSRRTELSALSETPNSPWSAGSASVSSSRTSICCRH